MKMFVASVVVLAWTVGGTLLRGQKEGAVCDFEWMHSPDALTAVVQKVSKETDKVGGPQYSTSEDKSGLHSFQTMYYHTLMKLVQQKCAKKAKEERTIRVLEIGLGCGMPNGPGGSLRMWRTLIQEPLVLDLHIMEFAEDCGKKFAKDHPELMSNPTVGLHFGNQASAADLDRVVQESGTKPFDLVIDDGSHINEHQRFSLVHLFPQVAKGGIYVIEDTHSACKNWKTNWGEKSGDRPGLKQGDATVGGSDDCLTTQDGKPTILATIFEWEKNLGGRGQFNSELPGCTDIAIFRQAVLFEKELP